MSEKNLKSLIHPVVGRKLKKFTKEASLVLEVGCGPGQYRFATSGRFIGLDVTTDDYNAAFPRQVDVIADGMALPFAKNSFDLILYSNVFLLFPDAENVLRKTYRLLRKDGVLIIADYSKRLAEVLNEKIRQQGIDKKYYARSGSDMIDLLLQEGYSEVKLFWKKRWFYELPLRWRSYLFGGVKYYTKWLDARECAILLTAKK